MVLLLEAMLAFVGDRHRDQVRCPARLPREEIVGADRFRSTAAGGQAGIRFAANDFSSSKKREVESRQFRRRRAPDSRYAETIGRETGWEY